MAAFVLPNVVFWIAGQFVLINRAWCDVSYPLIIAVALFMPVKALYIGMSLAVCCDILYCGGGLYYFQAADIVDSLHYVVYLPLCRTLVIAGALTLVTTMIALGCAWLLRVPRARHRRLTAVVVAISTAAMLGADVLLGANGVIRLRDSRSEVNLAGASGYVLARAVADHLRKQAAPVPAHAASEILDFGAGHNIVIVLVESYGFPLDPALAEAAMRPYRQSNLLQRYEIETGEVKFHGATVAGEYRELCHIDVPNVRAATTQDWRKCIPWKLQSHGYHTTAYHGYTQAMFGRDHWYPGVGFQVFKGAEILKGEPRCKGPFPGVCDAAIAEAIRKQLISCRGKEFVYWVTLNSHLPLPDNAPIQADEAVHDKAIGQWLGLVTKVNGAVAAMAMSKDLPETEFLIVGDHAPPFYSRTRRDAFSASTVPYIHLKPRASGTRDIPESAGGGGKSLTRLGGWR